MRDNEIDNQIDEAARRLTAGEPGGDLRPRVLARIETSPAKAGRHVRTRARWIAVPAALTAAAVIAMVVLRPQHDVQPALEVQQVHEVQNVQGVREIQRVQVLAERPTNPANHVNRVNVVTPVTSAIEVESPFAPAPLDIAPLTVAPAFVEAIPPAPPIAVADLSVEPIDVRAIDSPDTLAQ